MKPSVNDILDIKVDRLTYNGGRGIGRHFNFAIFINGTTAPQDLVRIKIVQSKKNYAVGSVVEILEKSPHRTHPPCEYFKSCGGCQWQHIDYKEQLFQKKGFLEFSLKKLNSHINVDFIQSPTQYNYRNRIQLNYKKSRLGYYKEKTNELVTIDKCLIANEKLNSLIPNFSPSPNESRYEFAITQSEEAHYYPVKEKHQHNLFSQVNNHVNKKLISLVLQHSKGDRYSQIYDAYCGSGNFTLPLFEAFSKTPITGIDYSNKNIEAAIKQNKEIKFVNQKVEQFFKKNPAEKQSLIIIDPPRSGCSDDLFNHINNSKKIIYISCDLSTFERDAKKLIDSNYKMTTIYGLDMFPQTYHLETLAVFERVE